MVILNLKFPYIIILLNFVQHVQCQMECFCSGLTSNCSTASLYWSTLRVPVRGDDSGFSLTDRDPRTWLGKNIPVFNWDTYELNYKFKSGDAAVYYWALPDEFLGSKLSAYGGNLTVVQRAVGTGEQVHDSQVIMRGNGVTIHYGLGGGPRDSGSEEKNRVLLEEDGWFVLNSGVPVQATKEDFLYVLANIEVTDKLTETKLLPILH